MSDGGDGGGRSLGLYGRDGKAHLQQPGQAKQRVDARLEIEELQRNQAGNVQLRKTERMQHPNPNPGGRRGHSL